MSRRIIINDHEEGEVRVALMDEGRLEDLFIERAGSRTYLGNIYKARVVNTEPPGANGGLRQVRNDKPGPRAKNPEGAGVPCRERMRRAA